MSLGRRKWYSFCHHKLLGSGKSTLLRILAGKTLTKQNVKVLGKNAFKDGSVGITYLGMEWAHNSIVKRDVPVARLLMSLGAQRHQERCARLLDIMDVDPNWHMHQISDGQRRRVKIQFFYKRYKSFLDY